VSKFPTRIAVTGAWGFLGRHTVERFAGLPDTELVLALDLHPPRSDMSHSNVIAVQRDIRAPADDLFVKHGIELVLHMAYILRPPRDAAWARSINVAGTKALLKSCTAAGTKRVVYPSSTTVYGARPGNSRPFEETDAPNPVPGFQYSEDKVRSERLLARWAKETPDASTSVFRGCVVMGPAADNFILEALTMKWLPVPAFSDAEMQFVYIDDVVDAFQLAAATDAHGIFNLSGKGTVRWRRMVALFGNHAVPIPGPLLQSMTGLSWKLHLQDRSPAAGVNLLRYPWLASSDKARRELGWQPRYTSEQALLTARP